MSTEVVTSTVWLAQESSPFLTKYRYGRAENRTWPMGKADVQQVEPQ